MNTKELEIAIEQLERVHRDMNDCANRFILKDVIDQLRGQDVVKTVKCWNCGVMVEKTTDELVECQCCDAEV